MAQGVKAPPINLIVDDLNAYYNASQLSNGQNLQLGGYNLLGAFSEIRNIYAFGYLSPKDNHQHGIGLAALSEQEGPLITDNRLKASYWKKINLNEKWLLIGGAQAGVVNSSIEGTTSTPSTNEWSPDLDIGFTLQNEQTSLGLSINQIANSKVIPLSQSVIYKRFFTALLRQRFQLSTFKYLNLVHHSAYFSGIKNLYDFKVELELVDKFQSSITMGNRGLIFSGGVWLNTSIKHQFGLQFAYHHPTYSNLPNTYQSIQVHLTFQRKKI